MYTMNKKQHEKQKNAILYFASNLDKYQLGATKLAKLLYYLDFISYRERKKSITGATYFKQAFGPLPGSFQGVVGELVAEKKLKVEDVKVSNETYTKQSYEALKGVDLNVFDEYELELLHKLATKYRDWSSKKIIAKAHMEAPWINTPNGGEIDYKLAFDIDDFDKEIEDLFTEEDNKTIEILEGILKK